MVILYRSTKIVEYDTVTPCMRLPMINLRHENDYHFVMQLKSDLMMTKTLSYYTKGLLTMNDIESTPYTKTTCRTIELMLLNRGNFAVLQRRRSAKHMLSLKSALQEKVKRDVIGDLKHCCKLFENAAQLSEDLHKLLCLCNALVEENFSVVEGLPVVQDDIPGADESMPIVDYADVVIGNINTGSMVILDED